MKYLISIFVLNMLLFVACSNEPNSEPSANDMAREVTKKPLDGKKIFRQYCVTCHGVDGTMGANGAHDLSKSELPLTDRINVITNGRNTMTPFKGLLSDEKIAAVAAYTLELKTD